MMQDIQFVAGVGEARAKLLGKELGIRTVGDLLNHFPFRYIDRTRIYPIREVNEAAQLTYVQIRARIAGIAYAGEGAKSVLRPMRRMRRGAPSWFGFRASSGSRRRSRWGASTSSSAVRRSIAASCSWPTPKSRRWSRPFRARPRAVCRVSTLNREDLLVARHERILPHHTKRLGFGCPWPHQRSAPRVDAQ